MTFRCVFLVGSVLLLPVPGARAGPAAGQEADIQEEMQFVEALRKGGNTDLALDYLQRLARTGSPALKKELPLEVAKTRLEMAADEPDSGKRLMLYDQVLADFRKFLADNPGHFRTAEVNADIAQVTRLKGRTQLIRALSQDSPEARTAEGLRARATLVEAGKQLQKAAAELKAQLDKLGEPKTREEKAQAQRLEEERLRAELGVGLNLFDQAQTYLDTYKTAELEAQNKKFQEAQSVLAKLAGGDDSSPVTWEARAWVGRCILELGDPTKARVQFAEVIGADGRAPAEGQRPARYFRMLALRQVTDPEEVKKVPGIIIDAATLRWIAEYPGYRNTPEGNGVRYLLAQVLVEQADNPKVDRGQREVYLADARKRLREVEQTENDFTDRARRLKIAIIGRQGGFTRKVAELRTFEDCYVRAQYEIQQRGEDARKLKGEALEKAWRGRMETAIAALERGLELPDAKGKATLEVNNARAMLAFYCLKAGQEALAGYKRAQGRYNETRDTARDEAERYRQEAADRYKEAMARYGEAIRVGETFARSDPRSGQAGTAAIYALQAYAEVVTAHEGTEEGKGEADRMLALARYMEERWPGELAGELAHHQVGLRLLRQEDLPGAVKAHGAVTPGYPAYAFAEYQLADAALKADSQGADPLPGDPPGGYRRRALSALERIPDSVLGPDPATNLVYVLAKSRLGRELFKDKKYEQMQMLAESLLQRLPGLKLSEEDDRNKTLQEQLRSSLVDLTLYAAYGLGEVQFGKGNYKEVAGLLDPVVAKVNGGQLAQRPKNQQLALALLSMDLRSNVQLGRLEQTRRVLKALQAVSGDEGGAGGGVVTVVKQLVGLIRLQVEELRKKGDKAALENAVKGFSGLLDDLVKQQSKPSPELVLYLAQCYASMGQHARAAALLAKAPEAGGAGGGEPDSRAVQLDHALKVLLVRELRLSKDEARDKEDAQKDLQRAAEVLDEAVGTPAKPGWGARNIDVLTERVYLLIEQEKYAEAARLANALVKQLLPRTGDNTFKEHYLECYYLQVLAIVRHAQAQSVAARRDKEIREAATMIRQLAGKWENFGTEASQKRFAELLAKEPDLKAEYDQQTGR